MGEKPIIFKSSLWLKWTLLWALWILSFLILIVVSTNNELNILYNDTASHEPEFRLPKNQIGALSYTYSDPEENYRPVYSVCFKNLRAENNTLGIFETALHKVVKIQDFEIKFYQYTSTKFTATTVPHNIPFVPEDITADEVALIKDVIHRLVNPEDGWRVNIDLGNVSEISVNNFHYKVFNDNELFFAVQSKRAIASYKQSGVVLRGHVIIRARDSATLESNYVEWDMRNDIFKVKGLYVLNLNGVAETGRNNSFDSGLNKVLSRQAGNYEKEEHECIAKL